MSQETNKDTMPKVPQGYIDLVERRYNLKVIDSHYVLVDAQFQKYNMMLDVKFNEDMLAKFKEKYSHTNAQNHVAWEIREKTESIRFFAEIGNNIILLWDTLVED